MTEAINRGPFANGDIVTVRAAVTGRTNHREGENGYWHEVMFCANGAHNVCLCIPDDALTLVERAPLAVGDDITTRDGVCGRIVALDRATNQAAIQPALDATFLVVPLSSLTRRVGDA